MGNLVDVFANTNLLGPVNLWFDSAGDLPVIDWETGSVRRFDGTSGAFKSVFVTGMTNSEGFAIGPDGNLYVCDWTQNRVNRYNLQTGSLIDTFASTGGMLAPNGLAFKPTEPTSVDEPGASSGLQLEQNFPNPFSESATIRYALSSATLVQLSVYDTSGRELRRLDRFHKNAGVHEVAGKHRRDRKACGHSHRQLGGERHGFGRADVRRQYCVPRWSACSLQNFLNQLERYTNATIVGEPSSSSPNFVGEETNIVLPWSKLNASISTRYWQDSDPTDKRPWIFPDVPVDLSSDDYFLNRDPVMEVVLAMIRGD